MSEAPMREPVSPDDIAEALARLAPAGTFDVDLPGGRTLKFRYPKRYGEVRSFYRGSVEFWAKWGNPDDLLEELRPYAPQDWSEAYGAFLVYFWAADENRFSEKGALTLLRNPWVMDSIKNQIEEKQKDRADETADEEIDEAGKESQETGGTEKGSESPETPSESTPTS